MKSLDIALTKFIETRDICKKHNKYIPLGEDEIVLKKCMLSNLVDKHIPLSTELKFFYDNCVITSSFTHDMMKINGASIDIGNSILYISKQDNLYEVHYGYRWIGALEPYKEDECWDPNWVVIGTRREDPIVVDTSKVDSPVLAYYEEYDFKILATSLAEFFQILTIILEVVYIKHDGNVPNDEYDITEEFFTDLRCSLKNILKDANQIENVIDFFYEVL